MVYTFRIKIILSFLCFTIDSVSRMTSQLSPSPVTKSFHKHTKIYVQVVNSGLASHHDTHGFFIMSRRELLLSLQIV